ncbi:MAG TPA: prepilin-type N-terminal cleavage/methylation domain-containing protein [Dongiaceae bacterium]|nr:prepilin-type N-terminal cleavage/methylation domain-containing protein [Dongiaceae bacterium]
MIHKHIDKSQIMKGRFRRTGFTIVELLIVIVVIAILAAITIVSYNGIANRAKQSAAASAAEQAAKKVLNYSTLNSEQYPSDLATAGVNNDANTIFEYTFDNTAKSYCITATFQKVSYFVSNTNNNPTAGLCLGHTGGAPGPWSSLAVGDSFAHTCGITAGSAYCWGYNTNGQLGDGSTTNRNTPVAVSKSGVLSGKTVTAIAVGVSHTCAIASGAVYCWGYNSNGQLGNGSTAQSTVPVAVDTTGVLSGKTITAVSAGSSSTCAIASSAVYCWGSNTAGELGNGTLTQSTTPVAVNTSVMSGAVSAITVGKSACALSGGLVYCWGSDLYGRLGNGASQGDSNVPVAVDTSGVLSGKTVTAIATGDYHMTALAGGQAYAWGYSPYGVGDGAGATQNQSPVAVLTSGVLAGKTIVSITGGGYSTCAADSTGKTYCWGDGSHGHLGNDGTASSSVPVTVDVSGVLAGKVVSSLTSGVYHACGIASGYIYCWGRGDWASLGNGTSVDVTAPVQVTSP